MDDDAIQLALALTQVLLKLHIMLTPFLFISVTHCSKDPPDFIEFLPGSPEYERSD